MFKRNCLEIARQAKQAQTLCINLDQLLQPFETKRGAELKLCKNSTKMEMFHTFQLFLLLCRN